MIKSKITASIVAFSMAIPAVSWGSNILEDDKLSFQSKKVSYGPALDVLIYAFKESPVLVSIAAPVVLPFVFIYDHFNSQPIGQKSEPIPETKGLSQHIDLTNMQLEIDIRTLKSNQIKLKDQMHFTQTEMKTLRSDLNILKPQMHSTIEDLSNLKTNTYLLFDQQNKTIETLIDSTEKSFHDLESKL